jgi:hypothetical protein
VGFAFLVIVDGRERAAAVAAEYALLAAFAAYPHRDRLRAALAFGGDSMKTTRVKTAALAVVLAAIPLSVRAQGSGSTSDPVPGSFGIVRQIDGTLVSVDAREAMIVVDDKKTGKRASFRADARIKLRADKGSVLAGRRELRLADFEAGQPVRVGFRTTDQVAVELKLLRPER